MKYRIRKSPEQNLQEWYALFLSSLGVLFCASAGGMRTNIRTAIKMKRAGYRKGFPDIAIFEPRGIYHGMFVELKCGGKPKPDQISWINELCKRNYFAVFVPSNLDFRKAQQWLENKTREYLAKL